MFLPYNFHQFQMDSLLFQHWTGKFLVKVRKQLHVRLHTGQQVLDGLLITPLHWIRIKLKEMLVAGSLLIITVVKNIKMLSLNLLLEKSMLSSLHNLNINMRWCQWWWWQIVLQWQEPLLHNLSRNHLQIITCIPFLFQLP